MAPVCWNRVVLPDFQRFKCRTRERHEVSETLVSARFTASGAKEIRTLDLCIANATQHCYQNPGIKALQGFTSHSSQGISAPQGHSGQFWCIYRARFRPRWAAYLCVLWLQSQHEFSVEASFVVVPFHAGLVHLGVYRALARTGNHGHQAAVGRHPSRSHAVDADRSRGWLDRLSPRCRRRSKNPLPRNPRRPLARECALRDR